jgi:methylmalonyl-CoA/ethylmalonyl-CoA epimerase
VKIESPRFEPADAADREGPMSHPAIPEFVMHHVSLSVPDLEAAIKWYGEILGFSVLARMDIRAIPARGAFLKRGSLRLELWNLENAEPVPEARRNPNTDLHTCGTKHMALAVPDLQDCLKELVRRGVDIAAVQRNPAQPMMPDSDPLAEGKPPVFAVFIRDPGGSLIELIDMEGGN